MFSLRQAMRVVSCGVMDMLTSCYPDRMGVVPYRTDEFLVPGSVGVIVWSIEVKLLEQHPVSYD